MEDDVSRDYIEKVRAQLPPLDPEDMIFARKTEVARHMDVERYIKVNVTRNTKGYNTDVTVSVTSMADHDTIMKELAALLRMADDAAQNEIHRQKMEEHDVQEMNGT